MARISYVNGRYLPHAQAQVHIEDRGYQFSDGAYEVIAFYNRRLMDEELHMKRFERSLATLRIAMPVSVKVMGFIMRELMERNRRTDGTVYLQVTRGVARRDHPFPKDVRPSLVMSIGGARSPKEKEISEGVAVITTPDTRWAQRDIKSISLLANVLLKQAAVEAGVREAWLVSDKGKITECAVSNNYIINAKGELQTHPLGEKILGGITRDVVLRLAHNAGITVKERPFSVKEAKTAKEAFITSTTSNVLPVVRIDGAKVGSGKPGPVTLKLLSLYRRHIEDQTGKSWN